MAGKQAAIGQMREDEPDVMELRVGNIPPGATLMLTIEYLMELGVSQNKFWKIILQSKIWPRYLNK